ncbi:hypothetical protein DJ018_10905 [Phenylobacterium deserti]|uniref:Uncharacterized protein n=1 Tax=Phenylobacterium deserti TaxID=1914756 RepID=A0A328ADX9_9CAUL|nr:hypothetical protein DJ018_10905 [Phenylobacterium deserti]
MPGYRLYLVDAAGHFAGSDEFEAASVRDAMAEAELRRAGPAAELWQQARQLWGLGASTTGRMALQS